MPDQNEILEALKKVIDPEMGINIVDLGLVYNLKIEDGEVQLEMTLTSPACPIGPEIEKRVVAVVEDLDGIENCGVRWTFDPPWSEDMMSPLARMYLR